MPTSSDDRDSETLGACLNDDDVEVDDDLDMMHTRNTIKIAGNFQMTLSFYLLCGAEGPFPIVIM